MSITPQDFLGSAEYLAATDAGEVHQRNAISRVYYAAYHRSCEFIEPDGENRGVGSHRSYIEQLQNAAPGSVARRLGVSLGVVYSGRVRADYKLSVDVQSREFPMLLNRVKEIFTLVNATTQQANVRSNPHLKVIV